jgi:hypothetical protein
MAFNVKTGSMDQFRRDVPLADSTLKNPLTTTPLIQGEWLVYETSSGAWDRITGTTGDVALTETLQQNALDPLSDPSPVFSQRGDLAVQAIGKVAILSSGGSYLLETDVYRQQGLLATAYAAGTELGVQYIGTGTSDANAGRSVLFPAASTNLVVGKVEESLSAIGSSMVIRIFASTYIKA